MQMTSFEIDWKGAASRLDMFISCCGKEFQKTFNKKIHSNGQQLNQKAFESLF